MKYPWSIPSSVTDAKTKACALKTILSSFNEWKTCIIKTKPFAFVFIRFAKSLGFCLYKIISIMYPFKTTLSLVTQKWSLELLML